MDLLSTAVVKGVLADGSEVLAVTVEAGTAVEVWHAMRDEYTTTGLWPFLVDPEAATVLDRLPAVGSEEQELPERPQLRDRQREQHRSAAEIFASVSRLGQDKDEALAEILTFDHDLASLLDDDPQANQVSFAAETTTVGLVAAERGGLEIPALLDWNGAPTISGVEHAAVLADWHRRFGAELMTLTGDRIELHVPRPPTEPKEVMAVTLEQAGYCPDILFQCWDNVTDMAEWQVNGTLWCFWWD
jgi:hypothetical protein